MEKTWITWRHFKKLISSQSFFIWNKIEEKNNDEDIQENPLHFWEEVSSEKESITYGEIAVRTFSIFDKWLREKITKNKNFVIINGDKEQQISQTKEAMKGNDLIISPVFEFEDAIATPFAFDPQKGLAIYIKYSGKTKLADMVQPYWDYSIISKEYEVKNIVLFLPQEKHYKKGEIDLYAIDVIHTTKGSKKPFHANKNGESIDTNILDFVRNPELKNNKFPNFDDSLKKIKDAKNISQIKESQLSRDMSGIFDNPYRYELLSEIGFKYAGWNGKVVNKKMILNYFENGLEDTFSSNVLDSIEKLTSSSLTKDPDEIKEIKKLKNSNKIIWYDFEGYSLPYAPLDNVGPNKQLVFQVSVIETINDKEVRLSNVVIDPKTISNDGLFKIIEEVYSGGANAYVVYNQAYENTRLNEIVTLLKLDNDKRAVEAEKMVQEIIEATIDLMNIFKINSNKTIPPVLMHDQLAKSSIKNIEKHISKNNINLPRPIKEYKNLDIQNGGMAMEAAIQRAIGLIGDKEWKVKIEQLKQYCENDVRAMIMVYDFVLYLMGKHETN